MEPHPTCQCDWNTVNLRLTTPRATWRGGESGYPPTYGGGMNHLYYGDNLRVLRDSIKDDSGS